MGEGPTIVGLISGLPTGVTLRDPCTMSTGSEHVDVLSNGPVKLPGYQGRGGAGVCWDGGLTIVGLVSGLPTGVTLGDLFTMSTGSEHDNVLSDVQVSGISEHVDVILDGQVKLSSYQGRGGAGGGTYHGWSCLWTAYRSDPW